MIFLSTLLISMFITMALIPVTRRLAVALHGMDIPDERKVHPYPMPKSGGIAMAIGVIVPILLWARGDEFVRSVLIGAGIVVVFGLIDDFRGIRYEVKFAGQIAAALIVILYGGIKIKSLGTLLPDDMLLPDWFAIPLTLLVIVGVTNAINLADGLDGLAGGICLLSFACIGYLAYRGGNMTLVLLSVATTGVIFGFLRFNTYPATLFMGDAGSQLLGFLAGALSLSLTQGNTPLSPLLPLILLGFPVLDTLTVMFERISQGRPVFVADKNHFHHKLIRLGLFHTEAVFLIYIIQALLVTAAFVFRFYSEWFLLTFYLAFSGLILSGFLIAERTGWKAQRYDLVDKVIKGKLRVLKDKNILIRVSFRTMEIGILLLLLFTCLLPASIPQYLSLFSTALLVLIVLLWVFKREWLGGGVRLALYLLIPFIVYLSETDMAGWMNPHAELIYNLSFGGLVIFVTLTLKFTRRKKGFKINPMDFLILFIALVIPNLPEEHFQSYHMGLVAAKMIVLFFSYEVLIGELRGNLRRLVLATVVVLAVLGVRGII